MAGGEDSRGTPAFRSEDACKYVPGVQDALRFLRVASVTVNSDIHNPAARHSVTSDLWKGGAAGWDQEVQHAGAANRWLRAWLIFSGRQETSLSISTDDKTLLNFYIYI